MNIWEKIKNEKEKWTHLKALIKGGKKDERE